LFLLRRVEHIAPIDWLVACGDSFLVHAEEPAARAMEDGATMFLTCDHIAHLQRRENPGASIQSFV
jgi:hypothetical protein